jgi:hypothetical protein
MPRDNGRLEEALDDTFAAFHAALAARFPECGADERTEVAVTDLIPRFRAAAEELPEMTRRVRAALRLYAETWLTINLP